MIISKAIDEFHSSFEYPCQVKNLKPLSKTTDLQKMASLVNLETKNGLINIAMKTPETSQRGFPLQPQYQ